MWFGRSRDSPISQSTHLMRYDTCRVEIQNLVFSDARMQEYSWLKLLLLNAVRADVGQYRSTLNSLFVGVS